MPAGRPTVMTPAALDKLNVAFSLGCSDEEACYFANISLAAFYKHQTRHPELKEVKKRLRQRPVFMARSTLLKGIQRDPKLALKFLERVKKDEFSLKTEVEVQGQVAAVFRWDGEPEAIEAQATPAMVEADEVLTAITDAVDMMDGCVGGSAQPCVVLDTAALHKVQGPEPATSEPMSGASSETGAGGEGPPPNGLSVDPGTQNYSTKPKPTEPGSVNEAPFNIVFPK